MIGLQGYYSCKFKSVLPDFRNEQNWMYELCTFSQNPVMCKLTGVLCTAGNILLIK